ncbi:hypothetical protein NQ317_013086 [Molorchus minor]|uniref:Uncharacterized protein n=1 Tax=Molorchus minor TaxID=1323400 RepID=A0ABQ9J127_9CUCU|nr:hypothetical protein NQ317_013086 [Molorchus minor]
MQWTSILHPQLIDVHECTLSSCLRVKGSFQEAALIIFPSTPHKKHGRWNEKMAKTGQEDSKQNIRIEGALFDPLDVHWIYLCCLGSGQTDINFCAMHFTDTILSLQYVMLCESESKIGLVAKKT